MTGQSGSTSKLRMPPPSSLAQGDFLGGREHAGKDRGQSADGIVDGSVDGVAGSVVDGSVGSLDAWVPASSQWQPGPPDSFDQILAGPLGQDAPHSSERFAAVVETRRSRRLTTTLVLVGSAMTIVLGAVFVYKGLVGQTVDEMPLPTETFAAAPREVVGRVEQEQSPERGAQPPAGLEAMGPNQVWVPQLKDALTTVKADEAFVPSRYSGLPTLRIPVDPRTAVWYSAGGAMWGGDEGTTLLAAHVATARNPGVFRGIDKLQPGDVVWTTDAENRRQAWAITQLWAAEHKAFPQEYFSAAGERRLVIVTCGGRLNAQGYYAQNVFAVAVPVTVAGSDPYEPDPGPDPESESEQASAAQEDEQASEPELEAAQQEGTAG